MKRVAALDLGSNTFLCLIAEADEKGQIRILADEVRTVRLSQELEKTKKLHPEALVRAESCLREFRELIDFHQVDRVLAVATSAARDATNSEELFRICSHYKIPIEIISGKKEAETSFQGGTFGHLNPNENILVIDIGGGSTEFILGNTNEILFARSQDVGAVRMTERHIFQQPVPIEQEKKLRQDISLQIQDVIDHLKNSKIDRIMAVAGTPTAIAVLENGGQFNEAVIDGMVLSKDRLQAWLKTFKETTIEEKKARYHLGGRADIIFAGLCILLTILEELKQERVYVSTKGVRYGLALHLFSER